MKESSEDTEENSVGTISDGLAHLHCVDPCSNEISRKTSDAHSKHIENKKENEVIESSKGSCSHSRIPRPEISYSGFQQPDDVRRNYVSHKLDRIKYNNPRRSSSSLEARYCFPGNNSYPRYANTSVSRTFFLSMLRQEKISSILSAIITF